MQFHQLKRKNKNRHSRLVGRGSKRGKTSGRGGKGQTARAGHKVRPEIRDFIKTLPKLRGRGKHGLKTFQAVAAPVSLGSLEAAFSESETVNPSTLAEKGLVRIESGDLPKVKILAGGSLSKKLTIEGCRVSASARQAIEKAGGTIKV